MSLIREFAREGRIVVVILHDLNLAIRWADRVVILRDGALAGEGIPVETVTAPMLAWVYGVKANVELSSLGRLQVSVEGVAEDAADPSSQRRN